MLPGDLKPTAYELFFHPYFVAPGVSYPQEKDQTFDGTIQISINVIRTTSVIILNYHQLKFEKIVLWGMKKGLNESRSGHIKIVDTILSPENETISLKLEREVLQNEKILLAFEYSGKIGINTERGFYKSFQKTLFGNENIAYATMSETKGARAIFPCFDEPDYKTNFKIVIVKPKSWIALSNGMEMKTVDFRDGYDYVVFEKFEKISAYLVSFAIGDFVKIEGKTADGILTRIWTFRAGEGQLKSALDAAIKCTDVLTNYTNFPLKIRKMDHLSIPEKQMFAMENPGLIIYDQRMLLLDDKEEINYVNKYGYGQWYKVAGTICHEMAHQWFGNLITNKWWGDSWLHEGLANYFETFALAKAYPNEKDIIDLKVADITSQEIIFGDHSEEHPIVTNDGDFDKYTYNKGGAVLRQLEAVISPKVFQKSIQNYIKTFAYSNANTANFIQKIQESVDEANLKDWCGEALNVSKFMDLWLNQKSIPELLTDYVNGSFSITQKVYNGNSPWPLPVFVHYENNKNDMVWLAPGYVCQDGRELPATEILQTSEVFINRDLLSIAKMVYSLSAVNAIYNALISNKNLQISPVSLKIFHDQIWKMGNYNEIFNHQKSAEILDIYNNL
uniref:Aminopeptidase n=1 Tax=Panagrolaimus davidi TaxID=227884 RepID=A0A914PTX1_9BILA